MYRKFSLLNRYTLLFEIFIVLSLIISYIHEYWYRGFFVIILYLLSYIFANSMYMYNFKNSFVIKVTHPGKRSKTIFVIFLLNSMLYVFAYCALCVGLLIQNMFLGVGIVILLYQMVDIVLLNKTNNIYFFFASYLIFMVLSCTMLLMGIGG